MPASSRPKVTVAMVTCNAERFVAEAIESVLAQDFADFELLVCDDASTDRTWELAQGFRDARIRLFRHPANIGEYPNRAYALAQARGEYLIYIDGDDYLYPHGLGLMCRTLDQFPDAAFASALPPLDKFIYPVELSPREFYGCQFLGPNITAADFTQLLFRTDALRSVGGFHPRYRSGDTHIQYVLARSHTCVLIGGGCAWWRHHPGQASESLLRERWGRAEFARYACELLEHPDCPLSLAERRLAKANACRPLLRSVVRFALRGRVVHALRLLRHSGISPNAWRFIFSIEARPFLSDRGGANPLSSRAPQPERVSALPAPVAGDPIRGRADRLGNAVRRAKVVDGTPAVRD